ncbi:MAG TPA: hypothetical protein PKU78_05775, partial [Candidatus Dojkabacteria bacterium]|nr:hypothetical protein [Candidatus Dojkabacteria bacterium]
MSENLNNPVESQNERSFTGWQLYSERNSEIIVAENVKDSFLNSSERVDKEGDNYPLVVLCVDERASLGNELNTEENKYALINVPGAGLEFLSDEDILNLLKISNGDINILAHKLCGWGTLVMDDILLNDNEPLDEQAGAGLARVSNAIGIAFRDESFRNMYSVHFSLDFVEYLPEIAESFLSERLKSLQNTEYKTIDDFS